jgi:alkanesulfonate monooxygenase SsuD/methylene tetrahydromethanopterin reductase-like flavin-dependent oxidoreductase (luciferase family)
MENRLTDYSVIVPFAPNRPEQVLPYAALVQYTDVRRLWQLQATRIEAYQNFAFAAGAGFRVPVGFGVTLMPLRNPHEAALQARSIAMTMGHPVVAGFAPGSTRVQQALLGAPYASPLTAAREYLRLVRGQLTGEQVETDGAYFTCGAALSPYAAPPVELGLGVLRKGMARLAGEVADVAITWLTPAAYLRDTLIPALRAGAASAGRPAPRVTAIVPLALTRNGHSAVELALASNDRHLRAPQYIDMLRTAGIEVAGDDLVADTAALVEGDGFVSGDPDQVVAKLAAYEAAGVDEIVLNVTGVAKTCGTGAALPELKSILAALSGAHE